MLVIPAIDLRNGKCVMLTCGKLQEEKVYSDKPEFIAKMFEMKGAKRIHVIDLDGAITGVPKNLSKIEEIKKNVSCEITVGGGMRSKEVISKVMKMGVHRVIISTLFIHNPKLAMEIIEKYKNKIIIALDITSDKSILIGGWKDKTCYKLNEIAEKLKTVGINEVIVTDTTKNGTLEGINFELMYEVVKCLEGIKIIISGGFKDLEDIKKAKSLNLYGIIVGKALYENLIDLNEAIKIASENK